MDSLKQMQSRFTPEMWTAYNATFERARELGPRYEPEQRDEPAKPTKESVLIKMAGIAAQMEGLKQWAQANGIKSEFLGT